MKVIVDYKAYAESNHSEQDSYDPEDPAGDIDGRFRFCRMKGVQLLTLPSRMMGIPSTLMCRAIERGS